MMSHAHITCHNAMSYLNAAGGALSTQLIDVRVDRSAEASREFFQTAEAPVLELICSFLDGTACDCAAWDFCQRMCDDMICVYVWFRCFVFLSLCLPLSLTHTHTHTHTLSFFLSFLLFPNVDTCHASTNIGNNLSHFQTILVGQQKTSIVGPVMRCRVAWTRE